jgi:pyruvate,water dikinase
VLQATPASAGRAVGTARVINGPADFGRARAGDVLVCQTTTPAWTPLFASAGALVTDTGGILSHAAIVAREYRLPAVVGCDVATTPIRDGARVEVDGDAGRVRVTLSEPL